MKEVSQENLSGALEKACQLSDLLNLIVEKKCTFEIEINDDPLINLCRDLSLLVANAIFNEINKNEKKN